MDVRRVLFGGALASVAVTACAVDRSETGATGKSTEKIAVVCGPGCTVEPPPGTPPGFRVKSYAGRSRCLDYTPGVAGSAVFVNDCAVANPIVVEERNDGHHTVVLHAGNMIIAAKLPRPTSVMTSGGVAPARSASGPGTAEYPLVLVKPSPLQNVAVLAANSHEFSLDGDSIILASNRSLVAKVHGARGEIGTPVVLGARNLADHEFWSFDSLDGIDRDPTSGFVRIGYPGDLYCFPDGVFDDVACVQRLIDVVNADPSPSPGTVVKIGHSLDMTAYYVAKKLTSWPTLYFSKEMTLRGETRGVFFGPELSAQNPEGQRLTIDQMLVIPEGTDDVRITGLRIRGPSRSTDYPQPDGRAIGTWDVNVRNIVDHDDISDWPSVGVFVQGHDANDTPWLTQCDPLSSSDPQARPTSAIVTHDFIHHNEMQNGGYGVESYRGAFPFIEGNTFVSNRHAIAAGWGTAHTSYRAWNNLVLSTAPLQRGAFDVPFHTHDFDVHGVGDNGFGGLGGDYFDVYRNTFLGTNRNNFELRGLPCNYVELHENISLESQDDAVDWTTCANVCYGDNLGPPSMLRVSKNPDQFDHANPTATLGVGDFDADGFDDLFLATGAAFYYSRGGMTAWQFLSTKRDTLDQLRFGDFDGDGRTDVFAIHGGQFVVSWGGVSDWEVIDADPTGGQLLLLPSAVTAMATGDFYGDSRSDVFFADGTSWWVWDAGRGVRTFIQTSSFRTPDLRFGDFDANGKTDVFGVGSTSWQVSYAPTSGSGLFSSWTPLRPKLTNTADGLLVGVFNDQRIADVVMPCPDASDCTWRISSGGVSGWNEVHQSGWGVPPSFVGVGHFLGNAKADLVTWNGVFLGTYWADTCGSIGEGTEMCISEGGTTAVRRYSTQDMR